MLASRTQRVVLSLGFVDQVDNHVVQSNRLAFYVLWLEAWAKENMSDQERSAIPFKPFGLLGAISKLRVSIRKGEARIYLQIWGLDGEPARAKSSQVEVSARALQEVNDAALLWMGCSKLFDFGADLARDLFVA